jgi:putative DNA primase/helicase
VPEHGGLRFHPRCQWPGNITKPCIIGRFTTALGNEPRGILRRHITGEKAITLGPMSGCVIRLWPDEVVEQHLVLGEGVETVLSMALHRTHRGKLLRPAWAVCVANNLRNFPILSNIEILTVLVDNDLPDQRGRRAGQEAAAKCAARWSEAGREVIRLTPNAAGTDFNDLVMS